MGWPNFWGRFLLGTSNSAGQGQSFEAAWGEALREAVLCSSASPGQAQAATNPGFSITPTPPTAPSRVCPPSRPCFHFLTWLGIPCGARVSAPPRLGFGLSCSLWEGSGAGGMRGGSLRGGSNCSRCCKEDRANARPIVSWPTVASEDVSTSQSLEAVHELFLEKRPLADTRILR